MSDMTGYQTLLHFFKEHRGISFDVRQIASLTNITIGSAKSYVTLMHRRAKIIHVYPRRWTYNDR